MIYNPPVGVLYLLHSSSNLTHDFSSYVSYCYCIHNFITPTWKQKSLLLSETAGVSGIRKSTIRQISTVLLQVTQPRPPLGRAWTAFGVNVRYLLVNRHLNSARVKNSNTANCLHQQYLKSRVKKIQIKSEREKILLLFVTGNVLTHKTPVIVFYSKGLFE